MNTITHDGVEYTTLAEFARATGSAEKTIHRHLKAGKVPGAWQDQISGRWFLPTSLLGTLYPVLTGDIQTSTDRTMSIRDAEDVILRETALARIPASDPTPLGRLIPLEDAAAQLGTTVGGVERMGEAGMLLIGPFLFNGRRAVYVEPTR